MSPAPGNVGVAAVSNTAETLFGRSRRPRHRTATGATTVEWAVLMHTEGDVVVLLGGGGGSAAINEAVVQAGAGPVPYGQVWLGAKSRHSAA